MVELRIVRLINEQHTVSTPAFAERFAAVRARSLGYVEGKLLRKDMPGESSAYPANLGAVCSCDDVNRLLTALEAASPNEPFTVVVERYAWAGGVVWYPRER